jgi:Fe-S-cluster containining protein
VSAAIDCGSCHGCCHQIVLIMPSDKPPPAGWRLDVGAPMSILERKPSGACTYLDPMIGCTIYQNRPAICREFHCGEWFKGTTADLKREILLAGSKADREMLASGQKHGEPK